MASINLTYQDRVYLERLVATEADHRLASSNPELYQRQVAGIVDTVLNRVASPQFPDTVADVANQPSQFSAINGPRGRGYDVWGSVQNVPDSIVLDVTRLAVNDWVNARISGTPSIVGGGLHYANPHYSDAKNRQWIDALDGPRFGQGNSIHYHGTTAGFTPTEAVLSGDLYAANGVKLPPGAIPQTVGTSLDTKRAVPVTMPTPVEYRPRPMVVGMPTPVAQRPPAPAKAIGMPTPADQRPRAIGMPTPASERPALVNVAMPTPREQRPRVEPVVPTSLAQRPVGINRESSGQAGSLSTGKRVLLPVIGPTGIVQQNDVGKPFTRDEMLRDLGPQKSQVAAKPTIATAVPTAKPSSSNVTQARSEQSAAAGRTTMAAPRPVTRTVAVASPQQPKPVTSNPPNIGARPREADTRPIGAPPNIAPRPRETSVAGNLKPAGTPSAVSKTAAAPSSVNKTAMRVTEAGAPAAPARSAADVPKYITTVEKVPVKAAAAPAAKSSTGNISQARSEQAASSGRTTSTPKAPAKPAEPAPTFTTRTVTTLNPEWVTQNAQPAPKQAAPVKAPAAAGQPKDQPHSYGIIGEVRQFIGMPAEGFGPGIIQGIGNMFNGGATGKGQVVGSAQRKSSGGQSSSSLNPSNHDPAQLAALAAGKSTFTPSGGGPSQPVKAMNGQVRNTY